MGRVTTQAHDFVLGKLREYMTRPGTNEEILDLKVSATGLDSLDLMELLNDIEETFEIRVEDDTVSAETTVAELVAFIERKSRRASG
jgi:acyl carrier protein